MRSVSIYIDTSIKGPKRRDGTVQYIIAYEASNGKTADAGDKIRAEDTTENHLTLLGLESALKRLNTPCILAIYLECPYIAAMLQNKQYLQWRYNGWMTARNEPVKDVEKWESILYLLDAHDFSVRVKEDHSYRRWMQRELAGATKEK